MAPDRAGHDASGSSSTDVFHDEQIMSYGIDYIENLISSRTGSLEGVHYDTNVVRASRLTRRNAILNGLARNVFITNPRAAVPYHTALGGLRAMPKPENVGTRYTPEFRHLRLVAGSLVCFQRPGHHGI